MNSLLRKIEADCFVHEDINVGIVAHERTDRLRNIGRREHRKGNLIEQRLEEMIIFAVHDRDIDRQLRQVHGRVDAGKAAAQYDDSVAPCTVSSCRRFCHRSGSSLQSCRMFFHHPSLVGHRRTSSAYLFCAFPLYWMLQSCLGSAGRSSFRGA